MLLRRAVVVIVVGLLVVVFLAGDVSAEMRRKEVRPQYVELGDPDQPALSGTFGPDKGSRVDNPGQAAVRYSGVILCERSTPASNLLIPIATRVRTHKMKQSERLMITIIPGLGVTHTTRR